MIKVTIIFTDGKSYTDHFEKMTHINNGINFTEPSGKVLFVPYTSIKYIYSE